MLYEIEPLTLTLALTPNQVLYEIEPLALTLALTPNPNP